MEKNVCSPGRSCIPWWCRCSVSLFGVKVITPCEAKPQSSNGALSSQLTGMENCGYIKFWHSAEGNWAQCWSESLRLRHGYWWRNLCLPGFPEGNGFPGSVTGPVRKLHFTKSSELRSDTQLPDTQVTCWELSFLHCWLSHFSLHLNF